MVDVWSKKNPTSPRRYEMNTQLPLNQSDQKSGPDKRKLLMATVVYMLVLAVLLAILSGRPDWVIAWAFAIVMGITTGITTLFAPTDREFVEERTQIKLVMKNWVRPLGDILSLAPLALPVVAGLDKRPV
jgi:hypothetical protein